MSIRGRCLLRSATPALPLPCDGVAGTSGGGRPGGSAIGILSPVATHTPPEGWDTGDNAVRGLEVKGEVILEVVDLLRDILMPRPAFTCGAGPSSSCVGGVCGRCRQGLGGAVRSADVLQLPGDRRAWLEMEATQLGLVFDGFPRLVSPRMTGPYPPVWRVGKQ